MTKWKGLKAVIRDFVILEILLTLGAYILGPVIVGTGLPELAIVGIFGLLSIFIQTFSYCLFGCLIKDNRWPHLHKVGLMVWVASFLNVILFQVPAMSWVSSFFIMLFAMLVGGGLSFLYVQPTEKIPDEEIKKALRRKR